MTDEQPHQHVFVLPPRGVSCQHSAGRLLAEQLCVFNTLPGRAAGSSCVHSCTNVISAPRYHPDGCLASCHGASRLLLPGSLLKPLWALCVCCVPRRASRVPLTPPRSAFPDRGIIMTFGSGSNGCLGHGNFTDVSQVCCRGAGHAAPPGAGDGLRFIRHVRRLIPAPGVCIPGVLWHPQPSPSSPRRCGF